MWLKILLCSNYQVCISLKSPPPPIINVKTLNEEGYIENNTYYIISFLTKTLLGTRIYKIIIKLNAFSVLLFYCYGLFGVRATGWFGFCLGKAVFLNLNNS